MNFGKRAIEFRARDFEEKQMLYGIESAYDGLGNLRNSKGEEVSYQECSFDSFLTGTYYKEPEFDELPKFAVTQFTGMVDKTGRKIFEGDVLKMHYGDGFSDTGVMEYSERVAQFQFVVGPDNRYGLSACEKFCEVLGNVFENPELVEVKS